MATRPVTSVQTDDRAAAAETPPALPGHAQVECPYCGFKGADDVHTSGSMARIISLIAFGFAGFWIVSTVAAGNTPNPDYVGVTALVLAFVGVGIAMWKLGSAMSGHDHYACQRCGRAW